MYNYGLSSIAFYGWYNTLTLFWVYLNGYCITWMFTVYVQDPFFDVNSTVMSIW
jgi:hypothetical protein